jgi:hypothetical protein
MFRCSGIGKRGVLAADTGSDDVSAGSSGAGTGEYVGVHVGFAIADRDVGESEGAAAFPAYVLRRPLGRLKLYTQGAP